MGAPDSTGAARTAWLVYDGACPFCSRYASLVRVREAVGGLELVDARRGGPLVEQILAAGLDLDKGMVLKLDQRLYHGAECLHVLAMLSTRSDIFNRWTATLLRSQSAARLLYPMLRAGRNAVLLLLGRSRLDRFQALSADDAAWGETKGLNTTEAYQRYLEIFPTGRHAREAFRTLLDKQFGSGWRDMLSLPHQPPTPTQMRRKVR